MAKLKSIQSDFGILDVKRGRGWLFDYFKRTRPATKSEGIGRIPVNKPLPVTIEAEIIDVYGGDDGVSREFELKIKKVTVTE
jgi:hypothetical protein